MTEFVTWKKLRSDLRDLYDQATRDEFEGAFKEYWDDWEKLSGCLPEKAERLGHLTKRDLRAISDWGGNQRNQRLVNARNTPEEVERATRQALEQMKLNKQGEALRAVCGLKHWGLTYGSKTLTFMRPSEYAILDAQIRGALRNFEPIYAIAGEGSEVKGYEAYLKLCRKLQDAPRPPVDNGNGQWRMADVGQALFALAQNDCVVLPRGLWLVDGD